MTDPSDNPEHRPDQVRVDELMERVRSLDTSEREAILDAADPVIAEAVRARLLSEAGTINTPADDPDTSLEDTCAPTARVDPPPGDIKQGELPAFHRRLVGRTLGPYRIQRLIGSGGMGQVWEAIQEQPKRSVALKVMRSAIVSQEARERFEYEVEILGRLQHPGIAQIYDAGTFEVDDEALPYFAMEYIAHATPLDEFARKNNLGIERRLDLFARVCDAVAHGHQRGIIHRDLKPANILVDGSGSPKIIDFGVARAVNMDDRSTIARTSAGQLIGTLQYMSPEQCSSDPTEIDVRADVYSLGVLLYELLTDKLPYDLRRSALTEAVRIIKEDLPPRITTFDRSLSVDIEVITGKALEKEPHRRYRSAGDLADDVRRYLSDEPIMARPPSMSEVIRRYARKNRAMATAVMGVLAAFLIGVVGMVIFAIDADRERDAKEVANQALTRSLERESAARALAEDRFQQVRSLATEVLGPISKEVKNLPGATKARMMMIETGRKYLDDLQAQDSDDVDLNYDIAIGHEQLADLLGGHRTGNIGMTEEARERYEMAEQMLEKLRLEDVDEARLRQDLSRVLEKRADLALQDGRPEEAMEILEKSYLLAMAAYTGREHDRGAARRLLNTLLRQGDSLSDLDKPEQAMIFFRRASELAVAALEQDPEDPVLRRDLALAERRLAWIHQLSEQEDDAREYWSRSLDRLRTIKLEEPDSIRRTWDVSWGCYHYGTFLLVHTVDEQGPKLLLESVELMTIACVASPAEATYRNDLAILVPAVHEGLIEAGHAEDAAGMLEETIITLQPVIESMPENLALSTIQDGFVELRRAPTGQ